MRSKIPLLLVLNAIFIGQLYSQLEPWQFVPDQTSFLQAEIMLGLMDQNQQRFYYEYRVEGDTIIAGKNYQMVYERRRGSILTEFIRNGFLRKHETNKVMYLPEIELPEYGNQYDTFDDFIPGQEILLYDFDVEVGDTIHLGSRTKVVQDIDSLLLIDGTSAKRIIFGFWTEDQQFSHDFWIEGLGSYNGLLGSRLPRRSFPGPRHFNLCSYFGGSMELVYSLTMIEGMPMLEGDFDCNTILQNHQPFKEELFKISPNPSSGNITLRLPQTSGKVWLTVFDYTGRPILSRTVDHLQPEGIEIELPTGFYVIHCQNKKTILTRKVIIY